LLDFSSIIIRGRFFDDWLQINAFTFADQLHAAIQASPVNRYVIPVRDYSPRFLLRCDLQFDQLAGRQFPMAAFRPRVAVFPQPCAVRLLLLLCLSLVFCVCQIWMVSSARANACIRQLGSIVQWHRFRRELVSISLFLSLLRNPLLASSGGQTTLYQTSTLARAASSISTPHSKSAALT